MNAFENSPLYSKTVLCTETAHSPWEFGSFNWNIPNDFSCHRPCCLRDSEHRHNIHLQTDALLLWEAMTIVEHYFLPNKYENSTGSSQKKFTLLQDISYECHSFLYPSAVSCLKESANMDKFRAYPSEI